MPSAHSYLHLSWRRKTAVCYSGTTLKELGHFSNAHFLSELSAWYSAHWSKMQICRRGVVVALVVNLALSCTQVKLCVLLWSRHSTFFRHWTNAPKNYIQVTHSQNELFRIRRTLLVHLSPDLNAIVLHSKSCFGRVRVGFVFDETHLKTEPQLLCLMGQYLLPMGQTIEAYQRLGSGHIRWGENRCLESGPTYLAILPSNVVFLWAANTSLSGVKQ